MPDVAVGWQLVLTTTPHFRELRDFLWASSNAEVADLEAQLAQARTFYTATLPAWPCATCCFVPARRSDVTLDARSDKSSAKAAAGPGMVIMMVFFPYL